MWQIVIRHHWDIWAPSRLGKEDDVCWQGFGHMSLIFHSAAIDLVHSLVSQAETSQTTGGVDNHPN